MSDELERRLRDRLFEMHRHVCGDPLECDADEDDPNEAGECDAWDVIRDASSISLRIGAEVERDACAAIAADCNLGGAWAAIRARGAK